MLVGRFLFIIPLLAVAGSLAAKKRIPVTSGTLPTHGALFVGLLVGTVIIVGALTFFPALSLGPIVEHFLMQQGKLFSCPLPQSGVDDAPKHLVARRRRRTRPSCCPRSWRTRARCSIRRSCSRATKDSFVKLNPVDADEESGHVRGRSGRGADHGLRGSRHAFTGAAGIGFELQIALWLWFTVLFANFAEAMAEARGKAQADTLRKTKTDSIAKRWSDGGRIDESVPASKLRAGRHRVLRGRRHHSRRRRSDRRHRHRGRIRHHRRKRAGDPRIRRRPQRRDRRHQGSLGSDQDPASPPIPARRSWIA